MVQRIKEWQGAGTQIWEERTHSCGNTRLIGVESGTEAVCSKAIAADTVVCLQKGQSNGSGSVTESVLFEVLPTGVYCGSKQVGEA